jgi:cellulose synthase/poly-beta-1,6-N-acetylglucosamine synthase-like glycosyltransferase
MDLLLHLTALIYLVAAAFLFIFAGSFGLLLVLYFITRRRAPVLPIVADDDLLSVTVQLPVYNEASVVARLIDACAALDYPAGKLHIQVLDDSTDHTTNIIADRIVHWREQGVMTISHIHRANRSGYKAGALAHGLRRVHTECVAIFDADFVPEADFLRRTMPHFTRNERLGLIQTRWRHLNSDYNLLTRAQSLIIDGHFVVEQVARSRAQLPMSMNGTGGIWRAQTILDAGGWSDATLTEDLDLSYRAMLRGWQFLYLLDVAVPGELPPQIQAYKMQQARWATGSTECLIRHAGPLLLSPRFSPLQKVMGLLHLAQYIVQPVILLLFLLTPPLLLGDAFRLVPDLRILTLVGIAPLMIIVVAQIELYNDWYRRLLYLPVQFMVAAAIVISNSRAVFTALIAPEARKEFKRTPKFRITGRDQHWSTSRYALMADFTTLIELCLAVYAVFGLVLALETLPAFAPYMFTYAVSFTFFAGLNLHQTHMALRQLRQTRMKSR